MDATKDRSRRDMPLGDVAGQFGTNHLGNRDEHLSAMLGFDEFFGCLYHLNAEEHPGYPRNPGFRRRFGSRDMQRS